MSAKKLIDFVQQSPTPFHAVKTMINALQVSGFIVLDEKDAWQLQPGNAYIVTRNDSSIIAFYYGNEALCEKGLRLIGAHTDSPNLKVKPNPDVHQQGFWQLGVETYGGVLLNPWFDRPLALAGRVSFQNDAGNLVHQLVNINTPVGMIPSLAIHLDREANNSRSINAQTDLPVIMGQDEDKQKNFKAYLKTHLQTEGLSVTKVLDYEMSFYEYEQGCVHGVDEAFISASRLDNLLSCYLALETIVAAKSQSLSENIVIVCNDHEEVGSQSAVGADGSMLESFLKRLASTQGDFVEEAYARMIQASMLISADNAHAVHPNFSSKHDNAHGPKLNAGPVIKINANQRYASNSETQAIFRQVCEAESVPLQSFVVRSDMACGSTIGPITASNIGIKTLDIGVPTFGMHSIREMAGVQDIDYALKALIGFVRLPAV